MSSSARARYLAAIPRPEIGAGSDVATLYAACRLVRGFALTRADAEALLWEWAGGRPGWTRDVDRREGRARRAVRHRADRGVAMIPGDAWVHRTDRVSGLRPGSVRRPGARRRATRRRVRRAPSPRRTPCSAGGSARNTTWTPSMRCSPPPRPSSSRRRPAVAAGDLRVGQRQDGDRAGASGAGAIVTSTISPRARCSRPRRKERAKDATGGLLRRHRRARRARHQGRDVDSVDESRPRARRAGGAARESTTAAGSATSAREGGRTPALDRAHRRHRRRHDRMGRAHDVIASMGDRFVLRAHGLDRGTPAAGRRAMRATPGDETQMRAELAAAVAGLLADVDPDAGDRAHRRRRQTSSARRQRRDALRGPASSTTTAGT